MGCGGSKQESKAKVQKEPVAPEGAKPPVDDAKKPEEALQADSTAAAAAVEGGAPMFELRKLFLAIDSDKDGCVSNAELKAKLAADDTLKLAAQHAGLMPDYHMFEQLDLNGDGRVSWEEFRQSLEPSEDSAVALLKTLFGKVDADADGKLTKKELTDALNAEPSLAVILEKCGLSSDHIVLEQLDTDGDGKVSWEEFRDSLTVAAVKGGAPMFELQELFLAIDADKDGCVRNAELKAKLSADDTLKLAAEHAGLMPDYHMFEQMDLNGDGRVSWEEFRQSLEPSEDSATALLKTLFGKVDADADGKLTRKELVDALNTEPCLAVILEKCGLSSDHIVLEQLDTDGDGKVSWEEFRDSLKKGAQATPAAETKNDETADSRAVEEPSKVQTISETDNAKSTGGCCV